MNHFVKKFNLLSILFAISFVLFSCKIDVPAPKTSTKIPFPKFSLIQYSTNSFTYTFTNIKYATKLYYVVFSNMFVNSSIETIKNAKNIPLKNQIHSGIADLKPVVPNPITISNQKFKLNTKYTFNFLIEQGGKYSDILSTTAITKNFIPKIKLSSPPSTDRFTFSLSSSKSGRLFYVLLKEGADMPTAIQIRSGSGGIHPPIKKHPDNGIPVTANTPISIPIIGIKENTAYKLYALIDQGSSVYSEVASLKVKTKDLDAFVIKTTTTNQTGFTFSVHSLKKGSLFYVLLPEGAKMPTAIQIRSGSGSVHTPIKKHPDGGIAITTLASTSVSITGLAANTTYQLYALIDQGSSVFSKIASLKIHTKVEGLIAFSIKTIEFDRFTFSITSLKFGKLFYVLLKEGEPTPTTTQMEAGNTPRYIQKNPSGGVPIIENTSLDQTIIGILPNTTYQLFMTVQQGKHIVGPKYFTGIARLKVKTKIKTEKSFAITLKNIQTTYNLLKFSVTSPTSGNLYYALYPSTSPAPTDLELIYGKNIQLMNGGEKNRVLATKPTTLTIPYLKPATTYKLYALVGRRSDQSRIASMEVTTPAKSGFYFYSKGLTRFGSNLDYRYTMSRSDYVSPDFTWGNAPTGTKGYVLMLHDLKSPNFDHWTVYIPAALNGVPENLGISDRTINSSDKTISVTHKGVTATVAHLITGSGRGYFPPTGSVSSIKAPPYQFFLYAIDKAITDFTGYPKRPAWENTKSYVENTLIKGAGNINANILAVVTNTQNYYLTPTPNLSGGAPPVLTIGATTAGYTNLIYDRMDWKRPIPLYISKRFSGEVGGVYWIVRKYSDPEPTSMQEVRSYLGRNVAYDQATITEDNKAGVYILYVFINGLAPNTKYRIYMVSEDLHGNFKGEQISQRSFTTKKS